jgi:Fe-S cluster assembly protein SufD
MSTIESYIAEAERVAADHRNHPDWLVRARRDALDRFQALGFPTTRDEEWRFTSVAPIAAGRFALPHNGASSVGAADVARLGWGGDVAATLVFVNGRYAPSLSSADRLPAGAHVGSLADVPAGPARDVVDVNLTHVGAAERHAFTALNTALLADGAFLYIADRTIVDRPIHVLFLSVGEEQPTMTHPRMLVVMGANSQASMVESYASARAKRYWTNAVAEIVVRENATLNLYRVQREAADAFHVGATYVRAARDAQVACHSVTLGGALVRNEIVAVLDGEGASCTLNGLYLSDGTRLVDNHTTIDHAQAHCGSREVYKGILADHARAVFNGKIIVRPDAQKTDAKQTNKALLLSADAQINTKPQLEIFANDVKCTHGAAIGQMDDEAIFYLRARGLSEAQARHVLIRAFAGDVLSQMPLDALRTRIDDELVARLPEWAV